MSVAYSILYSAVVSGAASSGSPGDVLIPDATTGDLVKATAAARGSRRSLGIALSPYVAGGVVDVQQNGQASATLSGLGAGTASWVRVSTAGTLERASVSGSDDVVGWCETDGTLHLLCGLLTAAIVNGGGSGFTPPTGTGFVSVTSGALDAASIKVNLASATYVTGTLGTANGGWSAGAAEALTNKTIAGASNTLTVRIANDVTGLGANVATFLATPSGANLASALTSALPVSKGGTGATASTGSGNVVLATAPTVSTATNTGAFTTGGVVQTGTTLNATAGGTVNNCTLGGNLRIRFTNASGPTITGFDATGIADGTILMVYAAAGVIAITSEDVASLAANRCTLQGGTTINLAIGTWTMFQYLTDGTNSRWRHLAGTAI